MIKAFAWIATGYFFAGLAALFVGRLMLPQHPIFVAATADITATIVIFLFSYCFNNSSFYDPYWSVAPLFIATYWYVPETGNLFSVPQLAAWALVCWWGVRLTSNWVLRWQGLKDEDWRYVSLRQKHGHRYWMVSFFGLHLLPTVLVFLACLPLYPALSATERLPNGIDILALAITGTAIWIETRADKELRRFRSTAKDIPEILARGLWAHCRHPNYLGEIAFWWGLYLLGLAANDQYWWTIIGPISITLLFKYISIPMIDKRMQERRPDYQHFLKNKPAIIPRIFKNHH